MSVCVEPMTILTTPITHINERTNQKFICFKPHQNKYWSKEFTPRFGWRIFFFFIIGKMNNEITQRSHERCHLLGTPPFLPQTHLGSIGHSILVVMGPKVNGWNKDRNWCTNNFKNMLEAFVTMVHKNYLLTIAFPFHSFFFLLHFSLSLFFFFNFNFNF